MSVFKNRYINCFLITFDYLQHFPRKLYGALEESKIYNIIYRNQVFINFSPKVLHPHRTFSFQYFLTSIIKNKKIIHETL